ncbi:hypothetical protein Acr_03g0014510 [Actinidia rufa]|uniref:Uncharacterized protein n=1 Tax=Actinidia rufa TaxID=165716 RepID=A0A7J0EGB3_9ERIC|nr:hypothetical protein Acr_03g0014510 [Actinidia rufa]
MAVQLWWYGDDLGAMVVASVTPVLCNGYHLEGGSCDRVYREILGFRTVRGVGAHYGGRVEDSRRNLNSGHGFGSSRPCWSRPVPRSRPEPFSESGRANYVGSDAPDKGGGSEMGVEVLRGFMPMGERDDTAVSVVGGEGVEVEQSGFASATKEMELKNLGAPLIMYDGLKVRETDHREDSSKGKGLARLPI